MRIFIRKAIILMLAAVLLICFAGCAGGKGSPKGTAKPSASPKATESPAPSPSASTSPESSASPSASTGPEGSTSPEGSVDPSASASPDAAAGGIEGFMEGAVVDPDDAPQLVKLLSEHSDYRDMAIQSVTYKLYEGRQAYYVVLQGEGEASHPIYVFADNSIIEDGMN